MAFWAGRVLVVEFSANLVGSNWLNLTLNLTLNLMLNLGPWGFLGRPRLGGGILCWLFRALNGFKLHWVCSQLNLVCASFTEQGYD